MQASRHRWVILAASLFAFVCFAFSFQLVPPLKTPLQTEFNIDDTQFGLLMAATTLPIVVLALPAGLAINRYGFRATGAASVIAVTAGSLTMATSNSYPAALAGRFVLGVGGTFLMVGTPAIVPQWFRRAEMGRAMSVSVVYMPLATILAFPAGTLLSESLGWRFPFYVIAAVSSACAVVFAATMREGPFQSAAAPRLAEVRDASKSVEVWKAGLLWIFFTITAMGYLTYAQDMFRSFKGMEPLWASLLASVFMYAGVFAVPAIGGVSDRMGRRKPFIVAGSALMGVFLVAVAYAGGLALLWIVVALGVSAAMVPPLVMATVGQSLSPKLSSTGFSIVTMCQNIGNTLAGPTAGYLLQTTASMQWTLAGLACFAFANVAVALTLRSR